METILAFETSCDDTAVAIVKQNGEILANIIYSQIKEHEPYGGIVPEIGSRAHIEQISCCLKKALEVANITTKDISLVAATFGPGLIGPLLVGAQFAKGFALGADKPLLAIHHIEGHILSGFLEENFPSPPFLALVASGGHSSIYHFSTDGNIQTLGQTLDDAAGEAFDKIGRVLGLPYPAGKHIDELAKKGDKHKFPFPIPLLNRAGYDFSFSGLKTKAMQHLQKEPNHKAQEYLWDFCASFQEGVCQALVHQTIKALKDTQINNLVLGGGVTANSRLREVFVEECQKAKIALFLPQKQLCTDNAVMIAKAAFFRLSQGQTSSPSQDVFATLPVDKSYKLYSA